LSLRGDGARKKRGHKTRDEEKLSVHGATDYMRAGPPEGGHYA